MLSEYRVFHNEWYKSCCLFLRLGSIFRSKTCGKIYLKLGHFGPCRLKVSQNKLYFSSSAAFKIVKIHLVIQQYIKIVKYSCLKYHFCCSSKVYNLKPSCFYMLINGVLIVRFIYIAHVWRVPKFILRGKKFKCLNLLIEKRQSVRSNLRT